MNATAPKNQTVSHIDSPHQDHSDHMDAVNKQDGDLQVVGDRMQVMACAHAVQGGNIFSHLEKSVACEAERNSAYTDYTDHSDYPDHTDTSAE